MIDIKLSHAGPAILIYRADRVTAVARRVFDIVFALLLLALSVPVMALAMAAIVVEDGFPVLFFQRRIGRYGRSFTIIKLRTMKSAQCGSDYKPVSAADSRITRVGRILRTTSVDELPQFINVLRGEMSIVGPRPEMPFVVRRYQGWQHLRHLVRPGLTCIWQARHRSIPLDDPSATLLDLKYVQSASLALDAVLVCQTVTAVVRRRGAI